ncbi:MFS transporter [Photorhabdus temperata subsp. temperata]|uniref:Major Facilitator Superfamily transporter n=1 Tax=Photorhabdus temperata subsp. temperata Meg1 TaxID=1393735 RepID=A0A081RWZ5_PHOTE|nr:MFS transporter [Photorhabdus temperata]KER03198.1 Major Facilitator Superfamily transporter [Photorhabdus temperata subsp. temperata Meg1]
MDKEFRKLILASSGNSFTLYLEMVISFTLITYHWNGGAIYSSLYTISYAVSLLFLTPYVSSFVDENTKPKKYIIIISLLCGVITTFQYDIDDINIYILYSFIKNILRLFLGPSNFLILKNISTNQFEKNFSYWQVLFQIYKMLAPLFLGFVLIYYSVKQVLILISVLYFISAVLYVFVSEPLINVNRKKNKISLINYFNIMEDNRILFSFIVISILTCFGYLSDSLIALSFMKQGLNGSHYSFAMCLSGVSGVLIGLVFGKYKINISLNIMLSSFFLWGSGYLLIGITNQFNELFPDKINLFFIFLAMVIIGIGSSMNNIIVTIYMQKFATNDNSAKIFGLTSISVGFSMFFGPLIGSTISYFFSISIVFFTTFIGVFSTIIVVVLINRKSTS